VTLAQLIALYAHDTAACNAVMMFHASRTSHHWWDAWRSCKGAEGWLRHLIRHYLKTGKGWTKINGPYGFDGACTIGS
jgi:hypothetical protein